MTKKFAAETGRLLIAGLGYSGLAVARQAVAAGWQVAGTVRQPGVAPPPEGVTLLPFAAAGPAIRAATHLLVTAAPGEAGDPVLAAHAAAIRAAPRLRWIGYLSTTGVYGDRGGAVVDEATPPAPGQARSQRRLAAEEAWRAAAAGRALDLFRTGGIYGPGRSVLDDLRAGTVRQIVKPGHAFGRIHRDDIALAVLAALRQAVPPGVRVLHLVDDAPAESAEVMAGAAALLGLAPPPAIRFADALATMSPMARSFWAENRRVTNGATKAALGIAWRYPSWREGLRAVLAEEGGGAPA
ncbi:Rossmann-fold NAD(P)-binding domain-containing protein [Siccirubricoccus phaeus]|uniref:SDR family NAD(P)-dependent oxidoreductase n=1 Tax=Siccirubricoccus phaeus TaxID=2595053 RepID=UPI0011F1D87C|nr:SDR family NAD(P)-dependent oxidoreductase [Siccirubricoccus phaeus]